MATKFTHRGFTIENKAKDRKGDWHVTAPCGKKLKSQPTMALAKSSVDVYLVQNNIPIPTKR